MAACFVTGSIDTVISVSVLWPPPCSSEPMSRMLRRSLPSHGGTETSGTWLPIGVGSGVGLGVASALGSAESEGAGEAVGSPAHSCWSSPMKMQPLVSASSASMS